ncbi:MAG: capsule biosynthesis protein [Pseudomonadota bacterium]
MTTKPRASKFRIKRSASAPRSTDASVTSEEGKTIVRRPVPLKLQDQSRPAAEGEPSAQDKLRSQIQAAQKSSSQPGARSGQVSSAREVRGETNIDAIRKEGLTGRQLRMARRVAQKNGIAATSDFEAVKLLREKGIDPFAAAGALELVIPNTGDTQLLPGDNVQLPQTVPQGKPPAVERAPAEQRAEAILSIQRDIASRRRKKMTLLFMRLAIFVGLPTIVMGYYFAVMATPLFATKSAFLIQQNESSAGAGGGLAGMFGTNQLATVQDSIAVQGYLSSREAMLRLDEEHGFKGHFQNEEFDAITRLAADASNEEAYKIYQKNVKIGYDPTEGIIDMEVIAGSPEASQAFSNALISYAEGQVSDLSLRLRNDQMRGARESYADAEIKRQEAAERLVSLQTELQTVDATGVIASAQQRIAQFETELEQKKLELQGLLAVRRPNEARVAAVQSEIDRLESSIAQQKADVIQNPDGGASLPSIQAQIQIAQIDFTTRDAMLQQALQALEASRIAADRQVRYIAISTPPTAPDTPTYPKVFENTFLAFLIFAGIYLMVSLTASILREQVSN